MTNVKLYLTRKWNALFVNHKFFTHHNKDRAAIVCIYVFNATYTVSHTHTHVREFKYCQHIKGVKLVWTNLYFKHSNGYSSCKFSTQHINSCYNDSQRDLVTFMANSSTGHLMMKSASGVLTGVREGVFVSSAEWDNYQQDRQPSSHVES